MEVEHQRLPEAGHQPDAALGLAGERDAGHHVEAAQEALADVGGHAAELDGARRHHEADGDLPAVALDADRARVHAGRIDQDLVREDHDFRVGFARAAGRLCFFFFVDRHSPRLPQLR